MTLADPRVRARHKWAFSLISSLFSYHITRSDMGLSRVAEARTRSVIISNLPSNTQEGLLQQVLEKIMPINRIEVFLDKKLAVLELQNQAVGLQATEK